MTLFSSKFLSEHKIASWGYVEDPLPRSFTHFKKWVDEGHDLPLKYLGDHRFELRRDLRNFFPTYQSSLVFLFTYAQEKKSLDHFYSTDTNWNGLKVASYTLGFEGVDYHFQIGQSLGMIIQMIQEKNPSINAQITLDVHPVLERDLAYKAGLGWFGKNSMLINPSEGSFVMIGSVLLDQKLELSTPALQTDHCGHCRACVEVCPTDAIDESHRTIVAKRCISTFTIELFTEAAPISGHLEKGTGEIFGCDLCQDICPWNKKKLKDLAPLSLDDSPLRSRLIDFFLRSPLENMIIKIEGMGVREFRRFFKGTSFERSGKNGILKNLKLFSQKD